MIFQTLLAFLDSLIPKHCVKSLNVCLSSLHIISHLQISSSVLASKDVCLTPHDSMLNLYELLSL